LQIKRFATLLLIIFLLMKTTRLYISPHIEIVEVWIEKGFATTQPPVENPDIDPEDKPW